MGTPSSSGGGASLRRAEKGEAGRRNGIRRGEEVGEGVVQAGGVVDRCLGSGFQSQPCLSLLCDHV